MLSIFCLSGGVAGAAETPEHAPPQIAAADPGNLTWAGRPAHPLDEARVAAMKRFVSKSIKDLGVPGAGFALIDHGKVVFEGGAGVRSIDRPQPIDAHTLFMIGSNTKGMSTLLLARLVDEGKLDWDEPVQKVYPSFRLGDPELTGKVLIRHLVCACTGLPRKDLEWIIGVQPSTQPQAIFDQLAVSKPTRPFGEAFQYSNLMAAAGGYIAGQVAEPGLDLGHAYDAAMQAKIFNPLGMSETTFDMARAQSGDFAAPHGTDLQGVVHLISTAQDYVIVPYRPAGGAWSSPHDMIKYIALELTQGLLPDGKRLVSVKNLLVRRETTVSRGKDAAYGMGLATDVISGVTVIHHGGGIDGYSSDIVILPDAQVGGVILTNSLQGQFLLRPFIQRLLELVYGIDPQAEADVAAAAKNTIVRNTKTREGLTIPAAHDQAAMLATDYINDELGPIHVEKEGNRTVFRFGLWSTEMATRTNQDGSISFTSIDPGIAGALSFELIKVNGKIALLTREAASPKIEYTYIAK